MAAASLLASTSAHSLLHSPPPPLPVPPPKPISSAFLRGTSSIQYNLPKAHKVEIQLLTRRDAVLTSLVGLISLAHASPASAGLDEDYARDTREMINQVKSTIDMDKSDPNLSTAVAALREGSNNWVAKYRREKQLVGKPSFGNMYSALNAISGHYISFGPTSPIPAKRKARIFEEVDIAKKALDQGR